MLFKSVVIEMFQVRETEPFCGVGARNNVPPHPCSPSPCIREETEGKEREDKPMPHHLRKRQAGTLGAWCLSGGDRGALTSGLPQEPEDKEREWLIIFRESGESHALRGHSCVWELV